MKGMTLIELIIYLALFSLIMGSAIVSAFYIVDAMERSESEQVLSNESDFVLAKIDWVLSGANSITSPALSGSGSDLTIVSTDTSLVNPISFFKHDSQIIFRENTTDEPLLETSVSVEDFTVTYLQEGTHASSPRSVQIVLTLATLTKTGRVVRYTATSTSYLKQ